MNEIDAVLKNLENLVSSLFIKIDELELKNKVLRNELSLSIKSNQKLSTTTEQLKTDIENLKITNSLLGSEEYKRDTKLKINSLVREIDYCIAQLAD